MGSVYIMNWNSSLTNEIVGGLVKLYPLLEMVDYLLN